jgi:hypothetical protein
MTNILSGKGSLIMFTLKKDYTIGSRDTVTTVQVLVAESETEMTSMSIGLSSFTAGAFGGGGSNVNATYERKSKASTVTLDKAKLAALYKCINDVYKASGQMAFDKKPNNAVCICDADGIKFGGEYLPDRIEKQAFFLEVNGAVFSLSKTDFEEVLKYVKQVTVILEAS